ncbi:MAG: hypothetical protein JW894_08720 [Bacteroidales bacterium]|nr:hypothetical protein [Bacteroidales bacterium]
MKKRVIYIAIIYFQISSVLYSQDKSIINECDANGYLSIMPSVFWNKDTTLWQTTLHNRLNFSWYISNAFTAELQLRNQYMVGNFTDAESIKTGFVTQNYFLPLTFIETFGGKNIISLSVDRAWLQYTYNNLEIKAGRQRINWGQTFVWNPNDLFNSYNFFEFDYPERPGADAIRIQYYTGATSSLDLASKIDSTGNISAAGLYRFNKWNYDFQFLVGYFQHSNLISSAFGTVTDWDDRDFVTGLGFSGAIKNLSIRSEMSYFHSLKQNIDSTNLFIASLAFDYTLSNQTYLMLEFFYNNNTILSEGTNFLNFYGGTQNVKTLSVTEYNLFAQAAYPINPIIRGTFGCMLFWDSNILGYYLGPSIDISLGDNLSLSSFYQFFSFRIDNPLNDNKSWYNSNFLFLRLKLNF